MTTPLALTVLAALLASFASQTQQSPPQPQPTQPPLAQVQPATATTAPCNKGTEAQPHKQGWAERKLKALACAQNKQLCDLPTSGSDITGATPAAKPCLPTATSTTSAPLPAPVLHLPTGVITTWLCNPIVTSTDPSHTVTFITPDALTIAEPAQAGAFEADGAKADPKATVSCASLRRDPKNNKVFLAELQPGAQPFPAAHLHPQLSHSEQLFSRPGGIMSPPHDNVLDTPILSLSESDHINVRALCEGTLITGAPGSGKSSCSGRQLACGLLRVPRMGGLVLTAKAEETQNWIRYAQECGREQDLILFNAGSGHCFDPLHYEMTRPGRGTGDLESTIDFLTTLSSLGKKEGGHGHDPFWELGNEKLMRASIKLLDLAGEPVSIVNIDRVIKSLPSQVGQEENAAWRSGSYCAQLIDKVRARQDTLTPDQWSDLVVASQFAFQQWPSFDERPRSSLEMTWGGMADRYLFTPYSTILCGGKCTFTPEMTTHDGKIVLCDWPMLQYGPQTGRSINVILKLIFQRA